MAACPDDDATLARRAADGCSESFAMLARRYQVPVVHYVSRLVGRRGHGDADDVAQDAFVRAWRAIGRYEPRWSFSTWLFTIARRTCLNHVRAARRRRLRETAAAAIRVTPTADPAATLLAGERAEAVWDAAARGLSERQFTALWLRYVEEKSPAEIALVLGSQPATVKVVLFRARRRLGPVVRHLAEAGA